MTDGNMAFFNVIVNRKVTISIDGEVVQTLPVGGTSTAIDMSDYDDNGGTGFLLQRVPGADYTYYSYSNDMIATARDDSMDIRTGYVDIDDKTSGTVVDEEHALAGNVTLTFTAAGSYKITIDGKDTFVTVDKDGSVNVNADKDITVADYTFPEDAVASAVANELTLDDEGNLTATDLKMHVDLEKQEVTITITGENANLDDTNLAAVLEALVSDYKIVIACGDKSDALTSSMDEDDIKSAIAGIVGAFDEDSEDKVVKVTVSDDGVNPVTYEVTLTVDLDEAP